MANSNEQTRLITELVENEDNPRLITDENLEKLITSILVFPKMLEIRKPIVKEDGTILGGNMRSRALHAILQMSDEEMTDRIRKVAHRRNFDEATISQRVEEWKAWQKYPVVDVVVADFATDEERQFIIKDNVSAGDWDMDALENFDQEDLEEFGVPMWGGIDDYMDYSDTGAPEADDKMRLIITFPRDRQTELEEIIGHAIERPNYRLEELLHG